MNRPSVDRGRVDIGVDTWPASPSETSTLARVSATEHPPMKRVHVFACRLTRECYRGGAGWPSRGLDRVDRLCIPLGDFFLTLSRKERSPQRCITRPSRPPHRSSTPTQ